MKYRKKPVVIEAVQLKRENVNEVLEFVGEACYRLTQTFDSGMAIETLEGRMHASYDDWIIRGVQGEFYPCKDSIFQQTYEPIEPEKQAP